jgi:prephenate dehydrogenase
MLLRCASLNTYNTQVLRNIPSEHLRGKMIVDVLSVKVHAKRTMLDVLPQDADILCTHPMFGPESGKAGWQSLPFLYDKVRFIVLCCCSYHNYY